MAVLSGTLLSSEAAKARANERRHCSRPNLLAVSLPHLGFLARPTKTAILRRLNQFQTATGKACQKPQVSRGFARYVFLVHALLVTLATLVFL